MESTLENDIMFDDTAEMQATLGKAYAMGSVKNDCDCSSYTGAQDEDLDTAQIA